MQDKRHYYVCQTVGCWDYHNARETKRARVDTRVKRGKERVSRLFRVFSTCEEKKNHEDLHLINRLLL